MSYFDFDPKDLQRLNRLMFLPRATSNDATAGSRRSRRAGDGSEFLDFRPYYPGDDARRIDWNVFGRSKQLFVRLSESPRQLGVTLLVDASRSMGFGSPTKLETAQRLACALGFLAMRGGDRLHVASFTASKDKVAPVDTAGVGPLVGARGLAGLVRYLQSLDADGNSDLSTALDTVRRGKGRAGAIVVISDFLNVTNRDEALRALRRIGAMLVLVQVLSPVDRGFQLEGNIRLRDSESGAMVDVSLDRQGALRYQKAVEDEREAFVRAHRGNKCFYALADTREHYLQVVCDAISWVGRRG